MNGKIVKTSERGSATVIALLVLALLLVFVALSVSRTTNETLATANDTSETRTFTAAEASLENMTQQFDSIFDFQLSPTTTDIANIRNSVPPSFTNYNFANLVDQTEASRQVVISGGLLQGLYATRDAWRLTTTTTDLTNGVEVQLRRTFFNDRVPIFQFGIFYDDDLESHPGPRFDFGGRVHSNGNLFLAASTGLYFSSRVTAAKEILTDVARNGSNASDWGDNVFIRDGSGTYQQLRYGMGSALKTGGSGGNLFASDADMPAASRNGSWETTSNLFNGNLLAQQKNLKLPLKLAGQTEIDYIELIKRGKLIGDLWNDNTGTAANPSVVAVTASKADNPIIAISRYANKPGLRVSLADSKAKLPGCATTTGAAVVTICGIRLDGDANGLGLYTAGGVRGYQPLPMGGYQSTRLNGERFVPRDSNGNPIAGRELWIKVELVSVDQATSLPLTTDVTEDILSLGITEKAPMICTGTCTTVGNIDFAILNNSATSLTSANLIYHNFNGNEGYDSRSIIRLQRFKIDGVKIETPTPDGSQSHADRRDGFFLSSRTWNTNVYNFVFTNEGNSGNPTLTHSSVIPIDSGFADNPAHKKLAVIGDTNKSRWIVPFPIKMFDTREGLYNEDINTTTAYGDKYVNNNGVMSMVEIDVANLRRFLNGDFNSSMPTTTSAATTFGRAMRGSDVPESNGWVLYVSDRRGDRDFDGEYDMEDIYGNNDGIAQPGEDVDKLFGLETDYKGLGNTNPNGEAPKYNDKEPADAAAVLDHSYFRRAVRLVNGTTLPGNYIVNSFDTTGFTVASENAIYVQGNYNATGVASYGSPTPSTDYLPQGTSTHVPASVAADAVMILSNSWKDSRSFRYPFTLANRRASETTVRFAMISGDARSSYENFPHQGGGNPRMNGGVHNFKRFLEDWDNSIRLNYSGSLINMYNARNNNGAFKCCTKIYAPPIRNWTFDASFLSPERLPPGTPFFQVIQLTGFQRVNN
jgi:Tfp pilus assembly protein PilX